MFFPISSLTFQIVLSNSRVKSACWRPINALWLLWHFNFQTQKLSIWIVFQDIVWHTIFNLFPGKFLFGFDLQITFLHSFDHLYNWVIWLRITVVRWRAIVLNRQHFIVFGLVCHVVITEVHVWPWRYFSFWESFSEFYFLASGYQAGTKVDVWVQDVYHFLRRRIWGFLSAWKFYSSYISFRSFVSRAIALMPTFTTVTSTTNTGRKPHFLVLRPHSLPWLSRHRYSCLGLSYLSDELSNTEAWGR